MILDICGGSASELVIAGAVPVSSGSFTLRRVRGSGRSAASMFRRPGRPKS